MSLSKAQKLKLLNEAAQRFDLPRGYHSQQLKIFDRFYKPNMPNHEVARLALFSAAVIRVALILSSQHSRQFNDKLSPVAAPTAPRLSPQFDHRMNEKQWLAKIAKNLAPFSKDSLGNSSMNSVITVYVAGGWAVPIQVNNGNGFAVPDVNPDNEYTSTGVADSIVMTYGDPLGTENQAKQYLTANGPVSAVRSAANVGFFAQPKATTTASPIDQIQQAIKRLPLPTIVPPALQQAAKAITPQPSLLPTPRAVLAR